MKFFVAGKLPRQVENLKVLNSSFRALFLSNSEVWIFGWIKYFVHVFFLFTRATKQNLLLLVCTFIETIISFMSTSYSRKFFAFELLLKCQGIFIFLKKENKSVWKQLFIIILQTLLLQNSTLYIALNSSTSNG